MADPLEHHVVPKDLWKTDSGLGCSDRNEEEGNDAV
jgi:hypothetical protein